MINRPRLVYAFSAEWMSIQWNKQTKTKNIWLKESFSSIHRLFFENYGTKNFFLTFVKNRLFAKYTTSLKKYLLFKNIYFFIFARQIDLSRQLFVVRQIFKEFVDND